jgi:uncharacterized protein YjiS (DUF1127 family)
LQEVIVTTYVIRSSINTKAQKRPGILSFILETLTTWHDRAVQRRTLGGMSEYQLHDIGLSRSSISYEIEKPFWRV